MKHILALAVLLLLALGLSSHASAEILPIPCPKCDSTTNTLTHYIHVGCQSPPNPAWWTEPAEGENGQTPPRGTNCRWCSEWFDADPDYHWCFCTTCWPSQFWP